jgi:hypothetical protein
MVVIIDMVGKVNRDTASIPLNEGNDIASLHEAFGKHPEV